MAKGQRCWRGGGIGRGGEREGGGGRGGGGGLHGASLPVEQSGGLIKSSTLGLV